MRPWLLVMLVACSLFADGASRLAKAAELEIVDVEAQPLGASLSRVSEALQFLGWPLPATTSAGLREAIGDDDAAAMQRVIDRHALVEVHLNPESRVKVKRGPADATLQQGGYVPVLVKVVNESTVTKQLRIQSPQGGAVYGGESLFSLKRQAQTQLRAQPRKLPPRQRFLDLDIYRRPPLTGSLSGLRVEYALAVIYSVDAGKREATLAFDVAQGNQDIGFRGATAVLFNIQPATPVKLNILDFDGQPTTARLEFKDAGGRTHPAQLKRLAPDLFFQPQIYRHDGEYVLLPPGPIEMRYSRGPEYRELTRFIEVPRRGRGEILVRLERWVRPAAYGFFSGDHHIHAAGCAHYNDPTEGVKPEDMFRQVRGEGLNVGCILTWGPCYDFQRQFFSAQVDQISTPQTLLKYDLEISGFGSQALGHVCLLNLKNQTYPGSEGTKDKGWPTWTTPVLKWAKEQGGVTGYAHSASGLQINSAQAAARLMKAYDVDENGALTAAEAEPALLPDKFQSIDSSGDAAIQSAELVAAHDAAANRLPNLAIPEMNGVGAQEICVSTVAGVCDFISAMDTARIPEWNCWYHILNCGFPLKVSGETDFPCMSGRRVGQGRVYVQLGDNQQKLDFSDWCLNMARGRSYVSDGFAHALKLEVNGESPGFDDVRLAEPGRVRVRTLVAFAPRTPRGVAYGNVAPAAGQRIVGDTINLHAPRFADGVQGGPREVELVVNGKVVAASKVEADGTAHEIDWEITIDSSSWIAVRHFPQLHTNPVNVIVAERPIRASKSSALWCAETIKQLWRARANRIAPHEREAAKQAFDRAVSRYQAIANEASGE
ncbi:MAG: CehA/McbA family metallohydrolase [Pirellulaceae bacterium]|jgi:hypothetical protein|nr:CehA/McbA family metallohydrolase [Pirellulaceae bacterium]MDP7020134.1 CehA/McbA family metallohydrolase [Pirellulaceae bacterium]